MVVSYLLIYSKDSKIQHSTLFNIIIQVSSFENQHSVDASKRWKTRDITIHNKIHISNFKFHISHFTFHISYFREWSQVRTDYLPTYPALFLTCPASTCNMVHLHHFTLTLLTPSSFIFRLSSFTLFISQSISRAQHFARYGRWSKVFSRHHSFRSQLLQKIIFPIQILNRYIAHKLKFLLYANTERP